MKLNLRKVMIEKNIKRVRGQLDELESREAAARSEPVGKRDETYLIVNFEDQKKKLQRELERYELQLKAAKED